MHTKKILYILIILLLIVTNGQAAKLLEYGFENWGGTVATTPGYIFSTDAPSYCDAHNATTEVVTGYEGITPHTGTYMFLVNAGPGMDPMPTGITGWETEARNNVGLEENYCGDSTFNFDDVTSGEVFMRMWVASTPWSAVKTNVNAKLKLIRYYEAAEVDMIWYVYQNVEDNRNPQFGLDGPGSAFYTGTIPDFSDGEWHKHSMYVNYNTGEAAIWFDVENETLLNATIYHDYGEGGIPGGDTPSPLVLINNWSANNPTENYYFAMDDVEVWDSMPTIGTSPVVSMSGSGGTVYEETSITIQGTATASSGRTITGITSPGLTVTCDDGTCDEQVEPFSASSGVLDVGTNSFVFTGTDSSAETGNDTFNVDYVSTGEACTEIGGSGSTVLGAGTVILN